MIAYEHLGQRIINLTIQWSLACLFFIYLLIYPVIATPFGVSNMIFFLLFVPLNLGLCLLWGHCGVLSFGQVANEPLDRIPVANVLRMVRQHDRNLRPG